MLCHQFVRHKFLALAVKMVKISVRKHTYGSYRKIETGVPLFEPLCIRLYEGGVQSLSSARILKISSRLQSLLFAFSTLHSNFSPPFLSTSPFLPRDALYSA